MYVYRIHRIRYFQGRKCSLNISFINTSVKIFNKFLTIKKISFCLTSLIYVCTVLYGTVLYCTVFRGSYLGVQGYPARFRLSTHRQEATATAGEKVGKQQQQQQQQH